MFGMGPCAFTANAEKARTKLRIKMRRFFISYFLKESFSPAVSGREAFHQMIT
jgi:hypothetical protein